ncbi:MAG: SMP-30/gluconolactonase/LRE family protein [Candidatus Latescibacterota bacterium]|nr:MAG: SMP-30/gluconolactonase/LRE family protein [Candidatus Latescibacterota bacterium]
MRSPIASVTAVALAIVVSAFGVAKSESVPFDSDQWVKPRAQVVDHEGRQSLMGFAYLKDVEFDNGIIEVDIFTDGRRSYPGVVFRVQNQRNYERMYIRPHRAGLYPDAVQYTPVINGIAGWQLYNGDGCTAAAEVPEGEWLHIRIEVMGTQARVFLGDAAKPVLEITDLKHGLGKGSVGVFGPPDGTAYFSNFSYQAVGDLAFVPPPMTMTPAGMITDWELSQSFKVSGMDPDTYPAEQQLKGVNWETVSCDKSGLLDIARYRPRFTPEPDVVLARTTIRSDTQQSVKYLFGYSDYLSVFLNGSILFSGSSAYTERDPSFLGVVGLFDAVYLPLEAGDNELLVMVAESFGGWGLMCREAGLEFADASLNRSWETPDELLVPESAVYDAKRGVVYVSNYDWYRRSMGAERQYISKVSIDGAIDEPKWITGLGQPTGMVIHDDKLFVVERRSLTEIDPDTGEIVNQFEFPQPGFPNDVAVDAAGVMYISDTRKNMIYKFSGGEFEEWIAGDDLMEPNGLCIDGGKLLVGNSGDNCVKAVDLASKEITAVVRLQPGNIDGIKVTGTGDYIVSHWSGQVYRVAPSDGSVRLLLDLSGKDIYTADFDYVKEKNLLIVPTFFDNRLLAYELKG